MQPDPRGYLGSSHCWEHRNASLPSKDGPVYLGVSAFTPSMHRSIDIKARDLGFHINPSANVHILPVEAGFVGADNVGVLIAEKPYHHDEIVLIIDVGTNGELVIGNRKILSSSSCATGPALEGGHIEFGMRAAPGAISQVRILPDTVEVDFKVVGKEFWRSESENVRASGICGSGIIDAVAELYKNAIIDKRGNLDRNIHLPRLKNHNGNLEFVIAWKEETSIGKAITINQKDIRNVQLAKGAIYAAAKTMMKKLGIKKLDKVVLAAAIGSNIDKEKALTVEMFPDCNLNKVHAVGNADGDGARIALLNRDKRIEAEKIA